MLKSTARAKTDLAVGRDRALMAFARFIVRNPVDFFSSVFAFVSAVSCGFLKHKEVRIIIATSMVS